MLLPNNAVVCNLHTHAMLVYAITCCSMLHSCKDTCPSKTDNLDCTPLPHAVLTAAQTAVHPAEMSMLAFPSLQLSQSHASTLH